VNSIPVADRSHCIKGAAANADDTPAPFPERGANDLRQEAAVSFWRVLGEFVDAQFLLQLGDLAADFEKTFIAEEFGLPELVLPNPTGCIIRPPGNSRCKFRLSPVTTPVHRGEMRPRPDGLFEGESELHKIHEVSNEAQNDVAFLLRHNCVVRCHNRSLRAKPGGESRPGETEGLHDRHVAWRVGGIAPK
jgi:hypothetical protein